MILPAERIVLAEIRRPPYADRYVWTAFESDERFTEEWWDRPEVYGGGTYWYVGATIGGVEVARVELDEKVDFGHYAGAPKLGATALEIQFIEVAEDRRGEGIGTEFVRQLAARHPSRRLVAFSEEADDFWSSLGWDRYVHRKSPALYRPLFIQPSRVS